jgi:hypothetical protein
MMQDQACDRLTPCTVPAIPPNGSRPKHGGAMGQKWRRTVSPPVLAMGFPRSLGKLIFQQQTTAAVPRARGGGVPLYPSRGDQGLGPPQGLRVLRFASPQGTCKFRLSLPEPTLVCATPIRLVRCGRCDAVSDPLGSVPGW